MSDPETLQIVAGMFIITIISFIPFYLKFIRKKPERHQQPAHDQLQKKPVIPFDEQRTKAEPASDQHLVKPVLAAPEPTVYERLQKTNETLFSEIQSGFIRIVTQTKSFQDQIQLLQNIKKSIDTKTPLEGHKAVRFNENLKRIDQISDRYVVLYHNLRVLLENESAIRSPDILHNQRLKEIETIHQISALSRQLQPLLNENEDIVAPFIGYLR